MKVLLSVLQSFLKICIGIGIGNTFYRVMVFLLPILFYGIVNNPANYASCFTFISQVSLP